MDKKFTEQERLSLDNLQKCYENVLRFLSINYLQHTAIDTYNDYDATAISADTKLLIIEYKRRNIPISAYPDSIIELEKFRKLRRYWLTGNHPIYLVEYDDYVAIFDLSPIYRYNHDLHLDDDHLFLNLNCAHNSVNYHTGERTKIVRYLQYHESCTLVEKS